MSDCCGSQIPDFDDAILAGRGKELTIRGEGDLIYLVGVIEQQGEFLSAIAARGRPGQLPGNEFFLFGHRLPFLVVRLGPVGFRRGVAFGQIDDPGSPGSRIRRNRLLWIGSCPPALGLELGLELGRESSGLTLKRPK